jgi:peptide deformylase
MHSIIPIAENPALRKKAKPVPDASIGSPELSRLIAEMRGLLSKEEYGVALAAPQVGESLRLFVVSPDSARRRNARYKDAGEVPPIADCVYINPEIVKMSRTKTDKHEGCLSIRGKWGMVPRAEKVTLRYTDEAGEKKERGASGLLAHIFQHEMDHLEGIVYTDKVTELYDDDSTTAHRHSE